MLSLRASKGFDVARAYEAIKTTAMNPHYDSVATYAQLGWVPFDKENESVSKTLEYAYRRFLYCADGRDSRQKGGRRLLLQASSELQERFRPIGRVDARKGLARANGTHRSIRISTMKPRA